VADAGALTAHFNLVKDENGATRANEVRYLPVNLKTPNDQEQAALQAEPWRPLLGASLPIGSLKADGHAAFQFRGQGEAISSVVTVGISAQRHTAESKTPIKTYLLWLTAMVAFWATLALNIPDITRFAKSQKDQVVGQFLGLPITMALYSFIGVAVTCAAVIIFDDILITADAPWDPIRLIARLQDQPMLLIFAQLAILLATLSTNIAANVISPANSFSNLWPEKINFTTGGIITGVIGIVIMP